MGKVYGRAYPITQADAKAYRRVDRSLKSNPIGVTAMAAVNGRGAAKRSAREVARGKTRSERIARAEQVYRNGAKPMGRVTKRRKAAKRKSSARRKIPGTNYFRTAGGRYQNSKGKFVKASSVKGGGAKRRVKRKTKATAGVSPNRRRRLRSNKSVGASARYSAGYDSTFKKKRRAAAKAVASIPAPKARKRRRAKRSGTIGAKARTYKRVAVRDLRSGKTRLSYLYRAKKGKLRRIPTKALLAAGYKQERIDKGRERAASRIRKEGSAFVANKRKGKKKVSARQRRAGRRLAAYAAARRSGNKVTAARKIALRAVPLQQGDQFKGEGRAPVTTTKRRTRVRRNAKKRVRQNTKRRARLKRNGSAKPRRRVIRSRGRILPKKAVVPNRKKRRTRKKSRRTAKRTAGTRKKRRSTKSKRRSTARKTVRRGRRKSSKRLRRNGGFRLFRKNSFMANFKAALMQGVLATTGYLVHRVTTNLICDKLLVNVSIPASIQPWTKPLVGLAGFAVMVPVMGKVAPKQAMAIGAGMVVSLVQNLLATILNVAGQPSAASAISGYSNSRAYNLRNNRRRRGFGQHQTSIMPRYTPVRGYMQAAAGSGWQQAAAGQFQQAAAGEYFTATGEYFANKRGGTGEYFTATGEYFAPAGTKGVGGYEPAGQLAMQASAGVHQVFRDGLRPDGDLDWALDVAEAAAGVGEVPANGPAGGWREQRVPTESQWIPNGPLWAGEDPVSDSQQTSELAAGILRVPGGNGILSGG